MPPKRSKVASPATVLDAPPDALGNEGRAEVVANVLSSIQTQKFGLDTQQLAEDHSDEDPVPNLPPGKDGEVITYAKRRESFKAAEKRLLEANVDIEEDVRKLLTAVRKQRTAQLAQALGEED